MNSIFQTLGSLIVPGVQADLTAASDAATEAFYVLAGEGLVAIILLGLIAYACFRKGGR